MNNNINDFIDCIKYGSLKNDIDFFDIELIKKVLLIYVGAVNNCYNLPSNFYNNIIDKIKGIEV